MSVRARQQARLPLAAIAILAFLAFAAFIALRPAFVPQEVIVVTPSPVVRTLAQRPLQADAHGCASGAYVTGDMAGDASPAAIYDTMCRR